MIEQGYYRPRKGKSFPTLLGAPVREWLSSERGLIFVQFVCSCAWWKPTLPPMEAAPKPYYCRKHKPEWQAWLDKQLAKE